MEMCIPLFLPWNYKLSRKSKSDEIFIFTCWDIESVKLGDLDIFFTVEGWEGPIIFLWVFLNEDWGLLNTVYGFTIGKSALGILLSSGT